ncbi:hypothetical protein KR009_010182 [Drosophila setifemur]|nr:hypothetical protein KR009_010182 [Drosophila setifemur]
MSAVPVAIKTEEVILEHAEYNSAEELDEEIQLQLEDSGGENTYHIEYTTGSSHQISSSQRRQSSMSGTNTSKGGGGGGGGALSDGDTSGKPMVDSEKRMRREIANSNERRRMQSINAGFQNLRSLLPRHEGEKLSKAAILQQTFQYIVELENQKTQLLTQNSELKRQVGEHEAGGGSGEGGANSGGNYNETNANGGNSTAVAIKKRKLTDNVINIQAISDSSDEGLGSMSPEPMTLLTAGGAAATKLSSASILAAKELLEMKKQLEKERSLRRLLEDELQMIKRQLYSVATAPPGTAVAAASGNGGAYIPREVIEHTDNFVRTEDLEELGGTVSYVEIDEMTGQQQVVVCSSIEELEADAAAEIITEDQVHEEVILSSNSSTESENEVNVNAIAKAYADGSAAMLQPILQAAIKATPKVEVERIHEKIVKVKAEKHDQHGHTAQVTTHYPHPHRQNLETIVQAIRHLEGDHLFADGSGGNTSSEHKFVQQQQSGQQQHHHQVVSGVHHHHPQQQHIRLAQDAPLALTTSGKQHAALAELRPFLHLKSGGNKQVIITAKTAKDAAGLVSSSTSTAVTPTAIFKVQSGSSSGHAAAGSGTIITGTHGGQQQLTITTALKQCRPGVIVAKQLPSS